MKTSINQQTLQTHQGQEANRILRNCVHCGFCNATCPTYQLTGDELDGPRGRIYLIKQVLEGKHASSLTQSHLDRCLTCRNCESTCPSGVDYGELLDIGRQMVSEQNRRTIRDRVRRYMVRKLFLTRPLFNAAIATAQSIRTLLPDVVKQKVPPKPDTMLDWPTAEHQRKIILLPGCVQPALQPNIDRAAAIVLDRLGIQTLRVPETGCCGGISHHLDAYEEARATIKGNIDCWWPYIEDNQIEAIISTATGCEVTIKEYGRMLVDDPSYRYKAARISALSKDLSEYVAEQDQIQSSETGFDQKVAFHPPCTLQHGQRIRGTVESLLRTSGMQLVNFQESHLCCGSAGTYSILQKAMAEQLRDRKMQHIESARPDVIVTANIGCLLHLQSGTHIPVKHWIELLV